jgi:hypothetical protein
MADTVKLIVGTKKGAWIYTSDSGRSSWQISEPILPGWSIYHGAFDMRRPMPRFYAAGSHWAWGPIVARSDDGGASWQTRSPGLGFPKDMNESVSSVWHVEPGHESQPGLVYAGTQPAGLFKSEDWGESWSSVDSINRHEYRGIWGGTGGGASCIHSIQVDPRDPASFYISVSSGGTWYTDDGGKTWQFRNHAVFPTTDMAKKMLAELEERAAQLGWDFKPALPPNVDPASADEFHKVRIDPKRPDRLWGQAHIGVFRSDDRGRSWEDVTEGLPSFHGFPIAVTRSGPDAAYVVPLAFESDNFRVCDGQFAVWRSTNEGKTWERLTKGLPGPNDFQSAYREALDTDPLDPAGVYVGTSNGEVYASADFGDTWQRLPGTLPPILSVTAAVL